LQIIHTLGHGGAENTFRWLAWALRKEGVDVIAAIPQVDNPGGENWIAPALDELDVPFVTFDKKGSPVQTLRNIRATIERVRPDIVHSHLLDSNFYSSLACKLLSIPHISTEHGDVSFNRTPVSRIKYAVISLCSRFIVCVSDAVKEKTNNFVFMQNKLITIHNGIRFMESSPSSFREEFKIPALSILIGNIGNLYPVKGQKYLVRAFAGLLLSSAVDAYLVLIGRGAELDQLQGLVDELDIPKGRVIFTGFRNDIENILNAIDLYVQPSLSEGHPIAVLEAMSLGIPVIATAVGGIPEIIGENRFGTLVSPASWEGLLGEMQEYLLSRDGFREKACRAKEHARVAFSVEKMACNYLHVYRQALAGNRL